MSALIMSRFGARRGFTLIEVLVVVTIIALLISILLPSLASARQQARRVACSANLHQLGLAMEMYVSKYGCFVPVSTDKGEYGRWLRLIDNVRSKRNEAKLTAITRLGVCPSVPERAEALKIKNHRMDRDIAYGYNYQYLGDSRWLYKPGTRGRFPVRQGAIKSPVRTIAVADSEGTGGWCLTPNPYTPNAADPNAIGHHGFMIDPPVLPENADNGPAFAPEKCTMSEKPGFSRVSDRHGKGSSVLFVDGHVQWVSRKELEKDNRLWNGWSSTP